MAVQYIDQNADLVGTVAGPFNIGPTNNTLSIAIDGGAAQTITLTQGSSRSAQQVVNDINAALSGGQAFVYRGSYVRIRTNSANGASSTITIQSTTNDASPTLGFAPGTYIGYGRIKTTLNNTTKQDIINGIEPILQSVGWKTISGSQTTNLLMQCPPSPPGQDITYRVRFKDNGGNCVTVSIENYNSSIATTSSTTQGGQLLPGTAFTVIANKYSVWIFTPGNASARGFVCCFTVAVPQFLQGSVPVDLALLDSIAINDTDTTIRNCLRQGYMHFGGGYCAQIVGGNMVQKSASDGNEDQVEPMVIGPIGYKPGGSYNFAPYTIRFADGSTPLSDAWVAVATSATTYSNYGPTQTIVGYVWDGLVVGDSFPADSLITLSDGHVFQAITNNASANNAFSQPSATLFVCIQ
jgi:hypothetical protein